METIELVKRDTVAITAPDDIITVRQQWVDTKKQELEAAEKALESLRKIDATTARIDRTRKTVYLLRKVVRALERGYIAVPRFVGQTLRFDLEELPLKVIFAVDQAKAQKLFDEFRLVQGNDLSTQQYGGRSRRLRRDPLVVGVIREPDLIIRNERGWLIERYTFEEHFLISWWREEDVLPWDRF